MKRAELRKIVDDFIKEDQRWRALNVGDTVYEERCGGMEFEYCKMIIEEINVDERLISVSDVSMHIPATKNISNFLTEEEWNKYFK